MIYEVSARMYFDSADEAADFYHDCQVALPKAIVVKPGTPEQQCSTCEWHECHHDQTPPQPCPPIAQEDNCPPP